MLNKNKIKLGIAPIAWTNDDLPELGGENTFEQCVSEMALAGFTGSEVGNKYPKDTDKLKKALNLRGIQICNAWFSTFFTNKPIEYTVELFKNHINFLDKMGAKVVGVAEQGNSIQGEIDTPILTKKPNFTDDEWKKVAKGLNTLGKIAKERGLTLGYHHHMGTGIQTLDEIDKLMSLTDEKYVKLLFDTGHCTYSDIDPLEVITKYINRINHIHLKDIRQDVLEEVKENKLSFLTSVKKGVFTVPGDGIINFEPIFDVIEKNDFEGWLVVEAEQDPSIANPLEYAIKARNFINEKTGL